MKPDRYYQALAVTICLLVAVCLGVLLTADKGDAATPQHACVTNHEWASVNPGMSRKDVREVLDGDGNKGPSVGVRWYHICGKAPGHIRAVVWYKDGGRVLDGGVWVEQHGGVFLRR